MRTCVFCAFLTLAMSHAAAQNPEPQIWSGVFSAAQADRGRAVIGAHCTQCHGQNRSLSGELFMLHWEGHDLARLYRKIKDTMPPGRADSLSDADKLDALAHVLQQNGFPAGAQELSGEDAALQSIRVLPRGGPRPLPSGAVVQVIGCLAEGNNASWQVVNATEPTAATLQTTTADPGMADADTAANATFQLMSVFPSPAPHAGQRVLVKGLLIRNPAGDRINVVSLAPIGAACNP